MVHRLGDLIPGWGIKALELLVNRANSEGMGKVYEEHWKAHLLRYRFRCLG